MCKGPGDAVPQQAPHIPPKYPTMDEMKKALPPVCFKKSLFRSLCTMCVDFAVLGALMVSYTRYLETAGSWLPLVSLVYWNAAGFVMWWLFVVGHDCGHSTFSNYTIVNDICGHLCHMILLVPYWPWARSHNYHHMFHNHEDDDYSWAWLTEKKLASDADLGLLRKIQKYGLIRLAQFPTMMHAYLVHGPDGCHFYPFKSDRMWKDASETDRTKCVVSGLSTVVALAGMSYLLGTWQRVVAVYLVPVMVYGMWEVVVTYLQHHESPAYVYEAAAGEWSFVKGAFLTVDRTYGFGIDKLHHRISDGHVIHHLFFRQIPHYHLREATEALVAYLDQQGLKHLYRHDYTPDFLTRFLTYWYKNGLSCKLIQSKAKTAEHGG